MYVDSGADLSLLPRRFGDALGFLLSRDKVQEIRGIGGKGLPVVVSTVRLRLGTKVIDARVGHCLTEAVPLILGRMDVFDSFKITFDQAERTVVFQS